MLGHTGAWSFLSLEFLTLRSRVGLASLISAISDNICNAEQKPDEFSTAEHASQRNIHRQKMNGI